MRRGTSRRSEENQSLDEEIGKIPGSYVELRLAEYFDDHDSVGDSCFVSGNGFFGVSPFSIDEVNDSY
jgi:hypothetical protein